MDIFKLQKNFFQDNVRSKQREDSVQGGVVAEPGNNVDTAKIEPTAETTTEISTSIDLQTKTDAKKFGIASNIQIQPGANKPEIASNMQIQSDAKKAEKPISSITAKPDEKSGEKQAIYAISMQKEPIKKEVHQIGEKKQQVEKGIQLTEKEKQVIEKAEKPKEEKIELRKLVKVCKMGADHVRTSINNQDFVFSFLNVKAVTDGCGSGKHSEVGTRVFGQLFAREIAKHVKDDVIPETCLIETVDSVFKRMLSLCDDINFIFENYCFTILISLELEEEFVVYSCGDGYIIKENAEGISFEKLDDGEYPAYYAYNWVDPKALEEYKEGVKFKVKRFSKKEYINVGVASDGLRFYENLYEPEKTKLLEFLVKGKGGKIEMLINRNNNKRNGLFHDDISICF